MPKVKDVMSTDCRWVDPDATAMEIANLMKNEDIGCVPVGEDDKLIGIVTDRDIVVRVLANGQNPAFVTAAEIMSPDIYYCFDDQDVDEVCNNMGDMQVRRMPVVERDKTLIGVVSLGDLAQEASFPNVGQAEQGITAA